MESGRFLIVNGDDFGRTPGVTEGIIQAHLRGILTSTTVMVNLPGAETAVARAAASPRLDVGIHLTLTAGRPLLPPRQVTSLVGPGGAFHPIRRFVAHLVDIDEGEVRSELAAQVERFRSWGWPPTHLDAHHHVLYLEPRLFKSLIELAQQHRVPIRYPWPRRPISEEAQRRLAEAHRVPPRQLASAIAACNRALENSGVPTTDRCILDFYGPGATLDHLLRLIRELGPGSTEVMCHPGLADEQLRAASSYAAGRERELRILTDPRIREAVQETGLQLISFRSLPVQPNPGIIAP